MDTLVSVLLLVVWCLAVPTVMFGALKVAGYDWRRKSDYGLAKQGPPSLPVFLGVSFFIALVIGLAMLGATAPHG